MVQLVMGGARIQSRVHLTPEPVLFIEREPSSWRSWRCRPALRYGKVLWSGYSCQSPGWVSKKGPLIWGVHDCETGVNQKCEFWIPEGSSKARNRENVLSQVPSLFSAAGECLTGNSSWSGKGEVQGGVLDFRERCNLDFPTRWWFKSHLPFTFPQLPEFLTLSS